MRAPVRTPTGAVVYVARRMPHMGPKMRVAVRAPTGAVMGGVALERVALQRVGKVTGTGVGVEAGEVVAAVAGVVESGHCR